MLYLVFNEGYSATAGDALVRRELAAEAIRLARMLVALMPDEPDAIGLLALLLLQDSRREARVDAGGELVLLDEQDRSLWDQAEIEEGLALAERPECGLALVDRIRGLERYHLFHSARADLLRRLGRHGEARDAYARALGLATNPVERRFLERRLAELS